MSKIRRAPEQMSMPNRLTLPQVARYLAATTVNVIASIVVRRAERQARRELAALDDRTLGDMGLVRADLMSLLEVLAETRTAAVLFPSPWNCPRLGA